MDKWEPVVGSSWAPDHRGQPRAIVEPSTEPGFLVCIGQAGPTVLLLGLRCGAPGVKGHDVAAFCSMPSHLSLPICLIPPSLSLPPPSVPLPQLFPPF